MAFSSSSSSNNSTSSESSSSSSPCSSPCILSSLPQPSSQRDSKVAVPFLWEEKPGVSKPNSHSPHTYTSHSSKTTSLEYPPLPPPPRLSQGFLSQPRRREIKLLAALSLPKRKSLTVTISFKKPSSQLYDEDDDPFSLAFKACTTENNMSSRKEKGTFDRLQSALRGLLFKPTNKEQKSKGSIEYEDGDDSHHTPRSEVSLSSTERKLRALFSVDEKASKSDTELRMRGCIRK